MFAHAELSILLQQWTWEAKPLACRCYCEDGRRAVAATKDLEGSLNASAAPHHCYFLHWLLGVSRNRGNDQNCPKRLKRRWRRWVCICKCIKIPAQFSAGSDANAQFSGFATTFPHSTHNATHIFPSPPLYPSPTLPPHQPNLVLSLPSQLRRWQPPPHICHNHHTQWLCKKTKNKRYDDILLFVCLNCSGEDFESEGRHKTAQVSTTLERHVLLELEAFSVFNSILTAVPFL